MEQKAIRTALGKCFGTSSWVPGSLTPWEGTGKQILLSLEWPEVA